MAKEIHAAFAAQSARKLKLMQGPIVFMLGASFLLGGLKHHTQEYNRRARDQQRSLGVVRRRARADGLPDFRPDALFAATRCPLIISYG